MSTAPALKKEAGEQPGPQRYLALDAFRGFIMILLASEGFGFGALRNHPVFGGIAGQLDHVAWEGGVFWDMIQPAFMFMVGVAMPFALARRIERGATFGQNLGHVAWRSLKLIILSQILITAGDGRFQFQLVNVLCQIAFTYFLCFLIMQMNWRWQAVAAVLVLAGHWALFVLFPGPDGPFSKTGNIGQVIDRALLGRNYGGYYVTINFISGTVTTLFGVWTGNLLRSSADRVQKFRTLALAMIGCFAAALALAPFCPIVKRIWTPTFTLYSTGWVLFMMIVFLWLIEFRGYRRFAFPLVVAGMNSILIYSMGQVVKGGIRQTIGAFTGNFAWVGALAPVALNCATVLFMWYVCYWFYQRKIFLKL
jgi:heparan-alpha-glucosaminide N-acetyltransferase